MGRNLPSMMFLLGKICLETRFKKPASVALVVKAVGGLKMIALLENASK